jgi:phage FluMu protein Com
METVQLPCNHCGQLMAVSVEHMGIEVHCPHCEGVVQVPAAEVMSDRTWLDKKETPSKVPPKLSDGPKAPTEFPTPRFSSRPRRTTEPAWPGAAAGSDNLEDDGEALPTPPRIQRPKESQFALILLLFLIPYAVATTGYIAWLLYQSNQARSVDPLERLPDKSNEGAPRQIQHDLDVPGKLKTSLQQPLIIGDLEVTPLKIERHTRGKFVFLELALKMKIVGTGVEFNPMHQDFCYFREASSAARPYTFLQPLSARGGERLYGGQLEWALLDHGREKLVNQAQRLRPGQEMVIRLTTRSDDSARAQWMKDHPQDLLWRVQVRRGLVNTRQGQKSATAVIGVQFNSSAIEG